MRLLSILAVLGCFTASAWAREADDLKRQIDSQRAAVSDLERLDTERAVTDELTLLKSWLDEATGEHAKEKWDWVREVIDRCLAQAVLIREKTIASKLTAAFNAKDAELKRTRDKLEQTKKALEQANINKRALEMTVK